MFSYNVGVGNLTREEKDFEKIVCSIYLQFKQVKVLFTHPNSTDRLRGSHITQ